MKRSTISAKPVATTTPSSEDELLIKLINDAPHKIDGTPEEKTTDEKKNKNKKQTPLLIPPALLLELDSFIESQGTGISRSAWICQLIKRELNANK